MLHRPDVAALKADKDVHAPGEQPNKNPPSWTWGFDVYFQRCLIH